MTQPSVRAYDAIVIGSGLTGGWAAKELTEKGLRTLVLEAGRPFDPVKDAQEHVPTYDMPFRGLGDRRAIEARQPIQRNSVTFDELSHQYWTDDIDNPYSTPSGQPFDWFRARQVGGKSIIWGRQVYRMSDLDFEANLRDGVGVDWPIRYADIAPWYSYVEKFIGVTGQREGIPHLPDGEFDPPMALNVVEQQVRGRIAERFGRERVMTIGRAAILTAPRPGRSACHYCGPCHRGCSTRSYYSSPNSTLPAAQATGRMTLRPWSVVRALDYDRATNRVRGVHVIDARTKQELHFTAKVIFVCASAIESARLLLNSATAGFETGLANSSDQVGRNIMDHIKNAGATGTMEGFLDRTTLGNRPNGIYVPRFRNITSRHPDFIRGYGFQGGAGRSGWQNLQRAAGLGAAFKARLRDLGPWTMTFNGYGETLPNPENRATVHPTLVDRWGIPSLHISAKWGPNELAMHKDISIGAAELLDAAGARNITPRTNPPSTFGNANHEMGTCRMGREAKTSVLNQWNQSWDIPNLFITDGSAMTSSGCQNPSITYMALTARAVDYAVRAMKRREL